MTPPSVQCDRKHIPARELLSDNDCWMPHTSPQASSSRVLRVVCHGYTLDGIRRMLFVAGGVSSAAAALFLVSMSCASVHAFRSAAVCLDQSVLDRYPI